MTRFIVLCTALLLAPVSIQAGSLPDGPYVSTSATGEHEIDPDFATISLFVERQADTSALARDRLVEARNAVDDVLSGYREAVDDVELDELRVARASEFDPETRRQVDAGFTGGFRLTIRVSDFEQLSALYHDLAGLDPRQLDTPRFDVHDPEAASARARDRALANARAKAEAIAATQGSTLGPVWGLLVDPLHHLAGRVAEEAGGGLERMSVTGSRARSEDIAIEPVPVRFQATVGVVYTLQTDPE